MRRMLAALWLLLVTGCVAEPKPSTSAPATAANRFRTETLGSSVEGRTIMLYRFGDGPVGALFIAGVHGDETGAVVLGERLVDWLQSERVYGPNESVAVIPLANPDGAARGRRTNTRGVDLNRNFPARNWTATRKGPYHGGPAPLSEPESLILYNAVQTLKPHRIVSIHSIDSARECNNFDGPGEQLATRMSRFNGYPAKNAIGYPTPGSFGSWAGSDLQIPTITLELPRGEPRDKAWAKNREALLEAVRFRQP